MKKILITIMLLCSFALLNAEVEFTVGGALRLHMLPSVGVETTTWIYDIDGDDVVDRTKAVYLGFGFNIVAPVTAVYVFKGGWAIGGSTEFGYGFLGGPQVYSENTYSGTDYVRYFNYCSMRFNFLAKTPRKKDLSYNFEGGFTFKPGSLTLFRGIDQLYVYDSAGHSHSSRDIAYFGPNIFAGAEKVLAKGNVSLTVGGRISSEFAYYKDYYYGWSREENYFNINFGIEACVSWFKVFK